MLKIRLTRIGKKNSPAYRVVVADKKKAVQGKFIEIIGHYNPTMNPKQLVIDKERALFWMGQGAQASDTVNNLMADLGVIAKKDKINKVYGKKLGKKAAKEAAANAGKEPVSVAAESTPTEETKEEVVASENVDETSAAEEATVESPAEETPAEASAESEPEAAKEEDKA